MFTSLILYRRILLGLGGGAALAYLIFWAGFMGSSGLSTDEFGSVARFCSRSPGKVVSVYPSPKNHVFFSLVNSLTPGSRSFNPARARLFSILAVLTTALVVSVFFVSERLYLGVFIFLGSWAVNPRMCEILMQARGYGFLGLFTALSLIAAYRYIRSGSERSYLWLGVWMVLGIYTVPTYVCFAGPLLGCVWLARPKRKTFWMGMGAALVVGALYAPLVKQMLAAYRHYAPILDDNFGNFDGWKFFIFDYILPLPLNPEGMALVVGGLFVATALLWKRKEDFRFLFCAMAATAIFFAYCWWQRTIPVRTVAFIGVNTTLILAFLGAANLRAWCEKFPIVFPALETVACLALMGNVVTHFRAPRPMPLEDWFAIKRATEFLAGPSGKVEYSSKAKNFVHVADPKTPVKELKGEDWPRCLIVGARWSWDSDKQLFQPQNTPEWASLEASGRFLRLYVNVPVEVNSMLVTPMAGGAGTALPLTELGIEATMQPSAMAYTAGFHFNGQIDDHARIEKWDGIGWQAIPAKEAIIAGDTILVHGPSDGVAKKIRFTRVEDLRTLLLDRVWVYVEVTRSSLP